MSDQPDSEDIEKSSESKVVKEVSEEKKHSKPAQTLEEIAKDITIEEQAERGQFTSILITLSLIFGIFSLPFAIFEPEIFDWLPYSLEITALISIVFIISAVIVNKN